MKRFLTASAPLFLLISPVAVVLADEAKPAAPAAEPAKASVEPAKTAPRRTLAQLSADKQALAAQLVEILRIRPQIEASLTELHGSLDSSFAQVAANGPAVKHREIVEKYRVQAHKLVDEAFEWEPIRKEVTVAYAESFSEQELKDTVAFFNSPSGKAFSTHSAKINQSVAAGSRRRMAALNPAIRNLIEQMSVDIQTLESTPAPAPAAAK